MKLFMLLIAASLIACTPQPPTTLEPKPERTRYTSDEDCRNDGGITAGLMRDENAEMKSYCIHNGQAWPIGDTQ
jgi:hypothetical protein